MSDTLADLEARLTELKRATAEAWENYRKWGNPAIQDVALDWERRIDDLERELSERRAHAWALLMRIGDG